MKIFALLLLSLVALSGALVAQSPAVRPGVAVYLPESEFGQALSAAMLKKQVPVRVTKDRDTADFVMDEKSKADKEGTAERVATMLAFGALAGSGQSYEAHVTLANREGTVVFAHTSKTGEMKAAAEDVANKLRDRLKNKQ